MRIHVGYKNYLVSIFLLLLLINLVTSCAGNNSEDDKTNNSTNATPLISPDGNIPSYKSIDPAIKKTIVDEDPDSPVAATFYFQPDDHGIEKMVLFGPKIDTGEPADFAIIHLVNSDTTAFLDLDSNGRLSSISAGNLNLQFKYNDTELTLELHSQDQIFTSDPISLDEDTATDSDGGAIDIPIIPISKPASRASTDNSAIVEWRDSTCIEGVTEVNDKTPVCMYIEVPALAGRTITVQTVEVDLFQDDPIGNPITLTLDEFGIATRASVAIWRDDEGQLGYDPEYRFFFNDALAEQLYQSPKLYVVNQQPNVDILEVNRGVAIDLLFEVAAGEPDFPDEVVFTPTIQANCQIGDTFSCRTWSAPATGNFMTVGVVHVASLAQSPTLAPIPRLDPEICKTWLATLREKIPRVFGTFAAGTMGPAFVDRFLGGVQKTIFAAASTKAATLSGWYAIVAGAVGAIAYEGGHWVGSQLRDGNSVDCQAVIQRAHDLSNLASTIKSIEFEPVEVCMANIPGWDWIEPCQSLPDPYQPFNPLQPLQSLGQLNFLAKTSTTEPPTSTEPRLSIVAYKNFNGDTDSVDNSGFNPDTADIAISGTLENLQVAWPGGAASGIFVAQVYAEGFGIEKTLYGLSVNADLGDAYSVERNIIPSPVTYGDYTIPNTQPLGSLTSPAPDLQYDVYYEARMTINQPVSNTCSYDCYEWAKVTFVITKP